MIYQKTCPQKHQYILRGSQPCRNCIILIFTATIRLDSKEPSACCDHPHCCRVSIPWSELWAATKHHHVTSACRYVEEIVNCRSGQLSAYEPSTNTVQGTSGCVIVSCRVARVTNSQPRQSCCQILDGEHFEVQLYCVGTFGSPQNFAPTLSLPTTYLRSTAGTSDKKCIVHISHVPLHCYQPNNSKFHPDSYFSSFSR